MFFPTSPSPPSGMIRSAISPQFRSRRARSDTGGMRARLHTTLGTIALGFAVLAVGAVKAAQDPTTTLAVFAAAAILVELWNGWDEFGGDAVEERPFTLLVPVQIAAILVLGPWSAALVAGVAILSVRRVQGSS